MEHRRGRRHNSFSLVKVRCNDQEMPGLVYNCNRHGLYILSTVSVQKNQIIEVLTTDFSGKAMLTIPGLVVHHNNSGFGLVFCKPDSAARGFVDKISYRLDAGVAGGVSSYG